MRELVGDGLIPHKVFCLRMPHSPMTRASEAGRTTARTLTRQRAAVRRAAEPEPTRWWRECVRRRTSAAGTFRQRKRPPLCPAPGDRLLTQPDRTIRNRRRPCARLHAMRILVVEDEVDLARTCTPV